MKKEKKKKKEFVLPTRFELVLIHKDKKVLTKVIKWLLTRNVSSSFQWEMKWLGRGAEYQLSIQSSWADNVARIAKLLGDYKQD